MSILSFSLPDAEIVSFNPGRDFKEIGRVSVTSLADVDAAISRARLALPHWRALKLEERLVYIQRFQQVLVENAEKISRLTTEEMGMPITASRGSTDRVQKTIQWLIDHASEALAPVKTFEDDMSVHYVHYEPYGVVGAITPWNVPISNFVNGTLQALIAGNTVVYKTAEDVPLFGKLLEDLVAQAGWPSGVFSEVYGGADVGKRLMGGAIDMMSFTGSTEVGQQIYRLAGERFVHAVMEMGGSDAGIVCEDADLEKIIPTIFAAKFSNAGQICRALKRLFVHQSRYDETIARLKDYSEQQKIGDPAEDGTVIGPLVNRAQLELIEEQVEDARKKGAQVLECGNVPDALKGSYYAPKLLLGVTPDMRAYGEELFGPVLPLYAYASESEVLTCANDTQYGLSGYVFTENSATFERIAGALQTGSIAQNTQNCYRPFNPFGGYKKSGMGRTLGLEGFRDVTRSKVVTREK